MRMEAVSWTDQDHGTAGTGQGPWRLCGLRNVICNILNNMKMCMRDERAEEERERSEIALYQYMTEDP